MNAAYKLWRTFSILTKQKEILKDSETFEKVANGNRGLHVPAPVEAGMEETHLTPNTHIYLNNFYLKDFSIYLF